MKYLLLLSILLISCKNYTLEAGSRAVHRSREWNYLGNPYLSREIYDTIKVISIENGWVKYKINNELKIDTVTAFLPL